ncbi:hypothetical protein CXIVA_07890 [Clostridium sp. SY8519]|uniref:helix-turn-helix domain-containing protein n=1 Tax=Clostridium sp. (strain SY8519) TaxID=1042156 RepID=UPI0002172031|nr:helix-turn-helix transcriptional regulator [Clostridium sp. SY8519]BAK46756.1 hypothetical protein CXIVA_07890 [Clostridium sp. SY8519]
MSFFVYNPFGQDPIDYIDETEGARVGSRIRRIRVAKGLSMQELAEKIGISADMMQKYENGQRKPKNERLKDIASVLGVEPLALADPEHFSYIGVMYTLFELEEQHGLVLEKLNDRVYMRFNEDDSGHLNEYISKWYDQQLLVNDISDMAVSAVADDVKKKYLDWEWTFPKALTLKPTREDKLRARERLKQRLEELDNELEND